MHFHAFIVDHGARSNSREEALEVGRELDSMSITFSLLYKSDYRLMPARNTILHFERKMARVWRSPKTIGL